VDILAVHSLCIDYLIEGRTLPAVRNVGFHLRAGSSLGIVGESGCGKTTVMLSLLRLLPKNARITNGQVLFLGQDLLRYSEAQMRQIRWREIAIVFQGAMSALNPVRTIESQILEVIQLHRVVKESHAARERVCELLRLVGISPDRRRQYPHQLSGGMRQRSVIAMALACNPRILIADEPTTALDVMAQAQILDLLKQLQAEFSLSLVLVTHDLGMIWEACDEVLVMYGDMIVEYASSEAIFGSPQHPYTQQLVRAYPTSWRLESPRIAIADDLSRGDTPPPGCRFELRCRWKRKGSHCGVITPDLVEIAPGHLVACFGCEQT
jgi:peptide/nickel transport system ATP-binding protein